MSKDELRNLLPFEQFLTRALIDESENEEEESSSYRSNAPIGGVNEIKLPMYKNLNQIKLFKSSDDGPEVEVETNKLGIMKKTPMIKVND